MAAAIGHLPLAIGDWRSSDTDTFLFKNFKPFAIGDWRLAGWSLAHVWPSSIGQISHWPFHGHGHGHLPIPLATDSDTTSTEQGCSSVHGWGTVYGVM